MARKPNTTDKIMYNFTVKMPPTIRREPDSKGINKIMQIIYTNLETLPTPQGGRRNGNIGIVMKLILYTILTTMAQNNTPDPGLYPAIPMNATADLRNQLQLQHDKVQIIY